MITEYLQVALLAFLPISEIRGALPWGVVVRNLPFWPVLVVSICFNILPYFLIMFGASALLQRLKRFAWVERTWNRIVGTAQRRFRPYRKWGRWGLIAFVGIPLPFTGVWTGSVVAFLADLKMKETLPYILSGLIIASTIVSILVFYGTGGATG